MDSRSLCVVTCFGDRPEVEFVIDWSGNHLRGESMDAMLKRFEEQAPVAVMARLGMQRAINADWVNELFEQHSITQYTRELLFSTVVDLMSLVASPSGASGRVGHVPAS